MDYDGKGTGAGVPRSDGEGSAAPRRAMTVSEAGRKGGITVRDERGHAFYEEIGRKGGQKVRELIERGKTRT
jgi:general stress protein YciG